MIRVLIIALLLYFLYQFIFHFLVPVSRTARAMKNKMNEFQNGVNRQQDFGTPAEPAKQQQTTQPKGGDYIDFEEVK